jgi:hypothetical protein
MDKKEYLENISSLTTQMINVLEEFDQDQKKQYTVNEGSFEWAIANVKCGFRVRRMVWKSGLSLKISEITGVSFPSMKIICIFTNIHCEAWMPTINDFYSDDWEIVE